MIDLSPKGVLEAIIVFPFMGLVALTLDSLSVVFIIFGLDDFGVLDTAGLIIFGAWIFIRSGGEKKIAEPPSSGKALPAGKQEKKAALKKAGGIGKRFGKVGIKAGTVALFEFIPYLGTILFGWTGLVIYEFISDLKASSDQEVRA